MFCNIICVLEADLCHEGSAICPTIEIVAGLIVLALYLIFGSCRD
jgi:hypothetical protein